MFQTLKQYCPVLCFWFYEVSIIALMEGNLLQRLLPKKHPSGGSRISET